MAERKKIASPTISSARRKFLTELAETTAEDYCAELAQVDPALILDQNDVTISYGNYGPHFDGMLHHENGEFHVYCNEERCGPRQEGRARFTLAHELGHFLIPEHNAALRNGVAPSHPSFCNKPNAKLYVEVEADFFASRVLMPEARFGALSMQADTSLSSMCKIASDLGTSLQSTALRYQDSLTHPCAFVVWREGKEPWFGVSAALRILGFIFIKRNINLIEGSATAVTLASAIPAIQNIRQSISVMSQWFPNVVSGSESDVPIREEAMKTTYATLTWLSLDSTSLDKLRKDRSEYVRS